MQTNFTLAQLRDPATAESAGIIRSCVHCGFCTATCPTFVELGDELDSPRGRIYLIKDMLENNKPATAPVVKHIDRCLSCLSCTTTCPSGVHYGHLVDHARAHVEETYTRPPADRFVRALLAQVLPYRNRFRLALLASVPARLMRPLIDKVTDAVPSLKPIAAMLDLAPGLPKPPAPTESAGVFPAAGPRTRRVAMLANCAQPVIAPEINEATVRLLQRHGCEVITARGETCCGAIVHHMGREDQAMRLARSLIDAWWREVEGEGLDAIVINVSGCGTSVKDYGHLLRLDPDYADKAAHIAGLARDVSELIDEIGLVEPVVSHGLTAAYHSACSMQHGQKVQAPPRNLLKAAGFAVREVPEGHLCCGSAGTYNILQPEIAGRLRTRKVRNIESVAPDLVATGNIGCITQMKGGTDLPIVHTAELLDWATGGPVPVGLKGSPLLERALAPPSTLEAAE